MNLFELSATLDLDTSEYSRSITQAKQEADMFSQTFKAIIASDLFKKAADVMADFAAESIEVASSLAEVQNVVDVTFADDSSQIDRWSQKANRSFGLTELQAKKYTSTLGAMMKSSGLAGDAVTEMSVELAGLAADMASFYNLDYDQAFEKIRSGISGETEPLKQLGINMSVANLEAYAMSKGITKAYESMSQAEQVQLRYNYLMQATADAQGDFARTSDSYANSIRTLEGNVETLKGKLGTIMIPLLQEAANLGNELFALLFPELTLSEEIEGIKQTYEDELESIAETDTSVGILTGMLDELGEKSSLTATEQERWNSICKELVRTLPSLSGIINTQTGEIEGGTKAILEYTEAYKENARQTAIIKATSDAQQALIDAQTAAADATVYHDLVQAQLEEAEKEWNEGIAQYAANMGQTVDELRGNTNGSYGLFNVGGLLLKTDEEKRLNALVSKILDLKAEEHELAVEEEKAIKNAEEGEQAYEDYMAAVEKATGVTREQAEATSELERKQADIVTALGEIETQLKSVDEYRKTMLAATRADIEKTVNGFKKIGLNEMAGDFDEDINTMIAGLKDQADYMDEYAKNLKTASEKGVNEGLLASLSDGTTESALYLRQIVNAQDGSIAELNAAWLKAQEGKETFAEVLTDQKLTVDTEYEAIIAKTDEMVANLDQKVTAYNNAANTAEGIVEGLKSKNTEINMAVGMINSKLSSIGAWTVGNVPRISTLGAFSTSQNAHGLDYVPTDYYPAWLHKGEAVLTRNEAEGWRATKTAGETQPVIDVSALAGAIVSAMNGVSIQMDKRAVGRVLAQEVSEEIARKASGMRYEV